MLARLAGAEPSKSAQADEIAITFLRDTAGATPFIRFAKLTVSDPAALQTVKFSVTPKPACATRPISATYPISYLAARQYASPRSQELVVPVFGLYAGFVNDIAFTFKFTDGSSQTMSIGLVTEAFSDPCGFGRPEVIQARNPALSLSYDFMLVKNACGNYSPTVIDTDGEIRWVGLAGPTSTQATFFDGAIYRAGGLDPRLVRVELDGSVTNMGDYATHGMTAFHHNLFPGKTGILFEANTPTQLEATIGEVDRAGRVLKVWNLAEILAATMLAGGDDPAQFVADSPGDWFHSNSACYRASDDTVIISSRENFVIALDYETGAIQWIFGDTTKKWAQFPSLRSLALEIAPGGTAPVGQHSVSIDPDDNLLLFDNGTASVNHTPSGESRTYSAARRYQIDVEKRTAREIWKYDNNEALYSAFCSSVYEDIGRSLLIDYAFIVNVSENAFAELVGLTAAGEKAFEYRYGTIGCDEAFNAEPIHWQNIIFPEAPAIIPPGLLANVSSRGVTKQGDGVMIGGFVVEGDAPKKILVRGLGPSLEVFGVRNPISDPTLELHDTSKLIAANDDYVLEDDLTRAQLVPSNLKESAIIATLAPGSYTAILRDKSGAEAPSLVEVFDLEPYSGRVANLSTRASVEGEDNVLIGGFIVNNAPTTVLVRALGPSLAEHGVKGVLQDPDLTLFNADGAAIATNQSWKNAQEAEIRAAGFEPEDDREAAIIATLQPGSYTAIVRNQQRTDATNGVGLVEIYYLSP